MTRKRAETAYGRMGVRMRGHIMGYKIMRITHTIRANHIKTGEKFKSVTPHTHTTRGKSREKRAPKRKNHAYHTRVIYKSLYSGCYIPPYISLLYIHSVYASSIWAFFPFYLTIISVFPGFLRHLFNIIFKNQWFFPQK